MGPVVGADWSRVLPGDFAEENLSLRQDGLHKSIARAFRWRRLLERGDYGSINDLAAAEKISPTCVGRLLGLTIVDLMERGRLCGPSSGRCLPDSRPSTPWSGLARTAS